MTGPASISYWLESSGDDLRPRPRLDGSEDVDVAILGAGFTGLWTATYLLRRSPGLRVAIVEAEVAGFGASGRNGAWCSSDLNVGLDRLERRHGRVATLALQRAMDETVDEVGRAAAAEGIDAAFRKGGALFVARGPHELPALRRAYEELARFGLAARARMLDAAETAERLRVAGAAGALANTQYAAIHPGRLVRGLARAVERRGATIYEESPVTAVLPGSGDGRLRPRLVTGHGEVRARSLVLAGEAYLARLRPLRRQLIPIYSLIVLTGPLDDAQWDRIGWAGHECVSSFRLTVDYLSRTPDGRILFGGRGAPYHFASRIDDAYDRHEPTHAMLRRSLVSWFPTLAGVRFTHAWGGPLGVPRDWEPTITFDRRTGVASARGYAGHGVSTANLAGRVLADLLLGTDSDLTALPLVEHRSPDWEPEPLRWLGVRYVQESFARLDRRAERTGRAPDGGSLAERLGVH